MLQTVCQHFKSYDSRIIDVPPYAEMVPLPFYTFWRNTASINERFSS